MSKMTEDMAAPIAGQGLGTCEKERKKERMIITLWVCLHTNSCCTSLLSLSLPLDM